MIALAHCRCGGIDVSVLTALDPYATSGLAIGCGRRQMGLMHLRRACALAVSGTSSFAPDSPQAQLVELVDPFHVRKPHLFGKQG